MNTRILLSALSILSIISTATWSVVHASVIGSGTVQGSGALTTNINWNDTFPGTASGTINGIIVRGRILPTLNMVISGSGLIDLGNMTSTTASSGSVSIEIGTNAANGASVTAYSASGGMVNLSDSNVVINNLSADGFADSYKFITALGTSDSTAPGFTQSGSVNQEVNSTSPVTLYTSNKPQNLTGVNDFTFTISAQPNAQTAAGDYQDKVVVTVTGNF